MASSISGTVTLDGDPVAGALVYAIDTDTDAVAGTATSGMDGVYSITGLDDDTRYHTTVEWEDSGVWYSARSQPVAVLVPEVTSVTVFYNDQAAPILARTGSDYALVAKDEDGNVLTGGTWSSSDPTNAPIDSSSGVASPDLGSSGAGITWTYLHSDGVHSGTITATVLLAATPIVGDAASNYTDDADLLANVASSVDVNSSYNSNVPTGGGGSLYDDGKDCNQIQIDDTRLFMGEQTFRVTLPIGGGGPSLRAALGAGYERAFVYTVNRFEPGFTMVGTGGGASAYKITPWLTWVGADGRDGPEGTNGTTNTGTGGDPGGTFDLGVGDGMSGRTTQTTYTITDEFSTTAPKYFLDVVIYEVISGNIISTRHWHGPIGAALGDALDNNGLLPYGLVEGPMAPGESPFQANEVSPFGENYNQGITTELSRNVAEWRVLDGITTGDPLGILGTQPTPTLSTATVFSTLTAGDTNKGVLLTGTGLTAECQAIFSNAGIIAQSRTIVSDTLILYLVDVDPGATSLPGTVAIYNAASQVTTSGVSITVDSSNPVTSGLVLDFDPTAGTSTTTDGDPIDDWTDQSSTGAVVAQTGSNRPTYQTNVINGLPVVQFDGTQWLNSSAAIPEINSSSCTVVTVHEPTGPISSQAFVFANRQFSSGWYGVFSRYNSGEARMGWGDGTDLHELFLAYEDDTAFHIELLVIDGTTPAEYVQYDGVTANTDTAAFAPATTAVLALGAENGSGDHPCEVKLARQLWYDHALSTAEVGLLTAYLKGLYGIA